MVTTRPDPTDTAAQTGTTTHMAPRSTGTQLAATYERPVQGRLFVHLDNGESWEATPQDLTRFRLVERLDAYGQFRRALEAALARAGIDAAATTAVLGPVRYLVEIAIMHPELLDHPDHLGWVDVAEIERFLREHQVELEARLQAARERAKAERAEAQQH